MMSGAAAPPQVIRTLADQVRKREKLKRADANLWQREWRLRLDTGLLPPPQPKRVRLEGKAAAGPAAPAPAAAAAAAGAAPAGAGWPSGRPAPAGRPTSATAEARAALAAAKAAAAAAAEVVETRSPAGRVDPATGLTPWGTRRRRVRPTGRGAAASVSPIKGRRGRPALRGAAAAAVAAAVQRRLAASQSQASSSEALAAFPFGSTADSGQRGWNGQQDDWEQVRGARRGACPPRCSRCLPPG
jgi:hypothetical protein